MWRKKMMKVLRRIGCFIIFLGAAGGNSGETEKSGQQTSEPFVRIQREESFQVLPPQIPVLTPQASYPVVQPFMPNFLWNPPTIPVYTPASALLQPYLPSVNLGQNGSVTPGMLMDFSVLPAVSHFVPSGLPQGPPGTLLPMSVPFFHFPACRQNQINNRGGLIFSSCPQAGVQVLPSFYGILPITVVYLPPVSVKGSPSLPALESAPGSEQNSASGSSVSSQR